MHHNKPGGFAAPVMKRTFAFYTCPHILRTSLPCTLGSIQSFVSWGNSCAVLKERKHIVLVVMMCFSDALHVENSHLLKTKLAKTEILRRSWGSRCGTRKTRKKGTFYFRPVSIIFHYRTKGKISRF